MFGMVKFLVCEKYAQTMVYAMYINLLPEPINLVYSFPTKFNGTVKKHSFNEYDKQDETTFNRVEIVKIVGKSEEDSPEVPF